jgi:hypothetical protein
LIPIAKSAAAERFEGTGGETSSARRQHRKLMIDTGLESSTVTVWLAPSVLTGTDECWACSTRSY